jgi:hypothetical protein
LDLSRHLGRRLLVSPHGWREGEAPTSAQDVPSFSGDAGKSSARQIQVSLERESRPEARDSRSVSWPPTPAVPGARPQAFQRLDLVDVEFAGDRLKGGKEVPVEKRIGKTASELEKIAGQPAPAAGRIFLA